METGTRPRQIHHPIVQQGEASVSLLLKSMRPKQWTKNLVIFAGLIFSQKTFLDSYLLKSLYAFVIFCILSGSVYIINDLVDVEKDRVHPEKKDRPLASGRLSPVTAGAWMTVTTLGSLAAAFWLQTGFGLMAGAYFLLTLMYSLGLKKVVIIDVLTIAFGFILRAAAGAVVIAANISPWLLVCTFLLALFLALTKRRHELLLLGADAGAHRKILDQYGQEMLDQMISVVTSSTVMAYSLYTFTSRHTQYLMATIPFVVYGIFRYQYLVYHREVGGSPETILLKDKPMLINVALWALTCALIIHTFA